jgi:rubrerythrin
MLEQAEAEGHRAKAMFAYAVKAEAVHAELYKRALGAVAQGGDLTEAKFYLCPFCGNIEFGNPPDVCPICGAPKAKFVEVALGPGMPGPYLGFSSFSSSARIFVAGSFMKSLSPG